MMTTKNDKIQNGRVHQIRIFQLEFFFSNGSFSISMNSPMHGHAWSMHGHAWDVTFYMDHAWDRMGPQYG